MNELSKVSSYQITHPVPVSTVTISLSQFKSGAIGNGIDLSDGLENLCSRIAAALSVGVLLDGLSVDMVVVKRESRNLAPTLLVARSKDRQCKAVTAKSSVTNAMQLKQRLQ